MNRLISAIAVATVSAISVPSFGAGASFQTVQDPAK
jgi:hypothetical protein